MYKYKGGGFISSLRFSVIILIVLCVFVMNAASANEMNESIILNENMSDVLSVSDENRLLESSKTFTNLNEDINNNQDSEVNLNSDYYFNSDSDSSFRMGISISRNVTVNGNGHTIDGKNSVRIFSITNSNINVVLKNLVLVNGKNANGGAISGNCIAQNCTFINNTAIVFGGAIYRGSAVECNFYNNTAEEGGAIFIDNKNVNIINCIFENNGASELGGAVSLDASVYTVVENCTFKKNKAETGGAMNVGYTKFMSLSNSTFIDNVATSEGGAVNYDFAMDNIVDNCYFENNHAMGQNGGAFTWIFSNGNITNNKFKRNSAAENGGAVYINLDKLDYLINNQLLLNCSFTDNHAANGGAIYNNDYYVIGESTFTFINNSASGNGGAVYCRENSDLSFSTFIANSAGGDGGAVYCNNKAMFFYSSFIENSAGGNGGAIYCNDECGFFDDVFINNSAQIGGSLYCNNSCSIYKSEFTNNSAYDAGAIYSNDYNIFYNLKFYNNSASNRSGAVYCGMENNFYLSEFINNSANYGPAVYTLDAHNSFKNSVFLLNKANFISKVNNKYLTLTLDSSGTFLNAIHSWFRLNYENVTYWNGTITNTNIIPPIEGCQGIIFTIEIYDSNNQLIRNFTRQTDENGQIILKYSDLEVGNYTCKFYHEDDDYYCEYSEIVKLTVGDFSKLQAILHYADENSTINLTRNYTYSIGFDTLISLDFENRNLSINGNGYTINALNHPCELYGHDLNSIAVYNCSFINNIVLNLIYVDNVHISDCNFTNSSKAIKCIESDSCEVVGCNFVNNSNYYGGAGDFLNNRNVVIKNSYFKNNHAYYGGAISLEDNNLNSISGCIFENNSAQSSGGAIYSANATIELFNSVFFNNSAIFGGAVYLMVAGGTVDYCTFVDNYADRGSAVYSSFEIDNIVLKDSIFLNNKASSVINSDISDDLKVTIELSGGNNFINAVYAFKITCENVTYWNGTVTNTDTMTPVKACPGQDITVLIYDEDDNLIANLTEKTNENGKLVYDILNAPLGSFKFVFYHENNAYYNESSSAEFNSSVKGDFGILQFLINNANENSIIDLARNYTFGSGVDGALIFDKNNVTLNGNGYVINALDYPLTIHVEAENITLRNVTFINGENIAINIWPSALNCVIDNSNFINNNIGDNEVIYVNSDNTTIKNTNFINITSIAVELLDCGNITIFNCSFINNTHAILSTGMDSILISECNFVNNSYQNSNYGTVSLKSDVVIIKLSNFTNNIASYGGAVYLEGNFTDISNCIFNGNVAGRGGAIYVRVKQSNITDCSFLNNFANEWGGAIYSSIEKLGIVDNSIFRLNSADEGAAIYCMGYNILKNSELWENNANSKVLSLESTDGGIVIKFVGKNNYINAIQSINDFEMENVNYWNGGIVNSNGLYPGEDQCSGQNITLEIYDSNDELVKNITLLTDWENKIYYNIYDLDDGNYSFKAYHMDDNYYSYIGGVNGNFSVNRPSSSVNIEIINKSEFYYSNCNISFNVVNKTDIRVVITDISGNHVYVNQTIDENYIIVNLDPNDDYYNVTVYNLQNKNYLGSQDSKLFKILKLNSSIAFNTTSDIVYNNVSFITFYGENITTVNVTIYDGDKNIVFENTTSDRFVFIPVLPVGTYNITLINNGDLHFNKCVNSTTFNIVKASNEVDVIVDDVSYGNQTLVSIFAQVDGTYTLDVSGTVMNITVVKGKGKTRMSLPIGNYYANVTFDNPNYNSLIRNATFNVLKAMNLVYVLADVIYGNSTVVVIFAQVDGNYTLDVDGILMNVSVVDGEGKICLDLSYGAHYANVTFNHPNYDSELINTTFYVLEYSDFNVSYYVDLYTGDVIFNMTVCNEATGNVTVHFGNNSYSASIYNGSATVRVPHPIFGDYNVVIKYGGDDNYLEQTENVSVHVKKAVVDAYDVEYGWAKSIIYSVKLIYEDGSACYNRNVSFYINGKEFKSTTDGKGIAQVVLGLNIGSYDIVVESEYGNVTKKIKVVSRFSGNKNINMYYYDGTKYSFNVYGDNGKLVGAGESVVIKLNKKTYTLKTDKNGVVSFAIPNTVKIGTYAIEASYKGQTIKNSVNVKQILSSKKTVKVKKSAKKLVLKAKLKKKLKGKKIIFKFKGKKYVAKTNKNGIAKVKINKKVIKKLKKGKKYTVKISYFSTLIKTKVKVR